MARYARTNFANGGFKDNTPGGWVESNGPVWWYGTDQAGALLASSPAGRSAVSRSENLIVNRIAAAPWSLSNGEPCRWLTDPAATRARANDALPGELMAEAFPMRLPRSLFWGAWIRSALSWGMGYLMYVPGGDGEPLAGAMRVLPPESVETDPWQAGAARSIGRSDGSSYEVDSDGRVLGTPYRLLELRNPTTPLDAVTGATPGTLMWHAAELGLIDTQLYYALGMYGGAGVPSGYLKVGTPDFTQEQADALIEVWRNAHGSGQRGTAVLNASTEYQPIAVSPIDAALVEMKRLSLQDVANAFGVPGYLIGAPEGGSMTYSNVEMSLQALYEFTLLPWAVAVEETLSALLPGSTTVRVTPQGETTSRRSDGFDGGGAAAADGVVVADVQAG